MSNQNIRRIPLSKKSIIVDFLNQNWGSAHPLVNNDILFNYYYGDGNMTNFYIWVENGETCAVCGYIKCSEKENSDIWISIWCAKKGKNGVGLQLMGAMKELTGANVMACNNIRENTMPFYTFLGYYPDKMKHYYRLSDKNEYKMAVVNKKIIAKSDKVSGVFLKKLNSIDEIKKEFIIIENIKPAKDYWYINKRYFEYPYYDYLAYGIYNNDKCVSLVVFRVNESDEGHVLRVVDYIGIPENFYLLSGQIDPIMEEFDCEYADCY